MRDNTAVGIGGGRLRWVFGGCRSTCVLATCGQFPVITIGLQAREPGAALNSFGKKPKMINRMLIPGRVLPRASESVRTLNNSRLRYRMQHAWELYVEMKRQPAIQASRSSFHLFLTSSARINRLIQILI